MFYVNDEPEGKFLYTETIKLYCVVLYFHLSRLALRHTDSVWQPKGTGMDLYIHNVSPWQQATSYYRVY